MRILVPIVARFLWLLESTLQVNGSAIGALAGGRASQRLGIAVRHWTWKKLFNFVRVELELRLGRTKSSGHPYEWEIDTTNICPA